MFQSGSELPDLWRISLGMAFVFIVGLTSIACQPTPRAEPVRAVAAMSEDQIVAVVREYVAASDDNLAVEVRHLDPDLKWTDVQLKRFAQGADVLFFVGPEPARQALCALTDGAPIRLLRLEKGPGLSVAQMITVVNGALETSRDRFAFKVFPTDEDLTKKSFYLTNGKGFMMVPRGDGGWWAFEIDKTGIDFEHSCLRVP